MKHMEIHTVTITWSHWS